MTAIAAHELVQTRDCKTAGCPNEADGTDGQCSYCRLTAARVDRGFTPTPRLQALAHELAGPKEATPVRTCTEVPGCTNQTVSDRGRYANVCAIHKDIVTARYRRNGHAEGTPEPAKKSDPAPAQSRRASVAGTGKSPAESREAPDEIVQLAQRVADCSRRVRDAYAEWEQAKQDHQAAVDAAREALDREAA